MEKKGLIIKVNGQDVFLAFESIVYIYSHENECDFIRENLPPIKNIRITLKKVMAMIDELGDFADHHMFKFSKNTIVNTTFQESIDPDGVQKKSGPQMMDLEGLYPLKDHRPWMTICYNNKTKTEVIEGTIEGYHKLMQLEKASPRRFLVRKGGHNVLSMHLSDWYKNEPSDNGIQYVDLGLPSGLKWATGNLVLKPGKRVRFATPEDNGSYIAFSETKEKEDYSEDTFTSLYENEDAFRDEYDYQDYHFNDDYEDQLPDVMDIVNRHLDSDCHIPTVEDWKELIDNCDMVFCTSADYTQGVLATSRINGKCIFLPAAGHKENAADAVNVGSELCYWTSIITKPLNVKRAPFEDSDFFGWGSIDQAHAFYCVPTPGEAKCYPQIADKAQFLGLSIRPVKGGNVPCSMSPRKFRHNHNYYVRAEDGSNTCSLLVLDNVINDGQIPETAVDADGKEYTVVSLDPNMAICDPELGEVYIPKTITNIPNVSVLRDAADIYVDEQNPVYTSIDGILFDKDKKTLLFYPHWHEGDYYEIPEDVTTVSDSAFDFEFMPVELCSIKLPKSLVNIPKGFLESFDDIDVEKGNPKFSKVNGAFLLKNDSSTTLRNNVVKGSCNIN